MLYYRHPLTQTHTHKHAHSWYVPVVAWKQVGRPGPKKKARMSRTRSDFLTRCNSEGATQSDDDDEYYIPAHSCTLPPSLSPPRAHPEADCHSDSEMVKYRISRGPLTSEQVFCPLRSPFPPFSAVGLATLQGEELFNNANPTNRRSSTNVIFLSTDEGENIWNLSSFQWMVLHVALVAAGLKWSPSLAATSRHDRLSHLASATSFRSTLITRFPSILHEPGCDLLSAEISPSFNLFLLSNG